MAEADFRLPTNKQRVVVFGRTGTGKTVFGAWLLSRAPFDHQPYIIVDYKGDELLGSIARAEPIGYKDVPKKPGLYYLRAMPGSDDEMTEFLWKVWKRGKTGLMFDEGYMVPNTQALQAILTQGRSLRVPVIMLSQRPVWLSRFAFSEADFFAGFHLNDKRDRQTVGSFTPDDDVWDTRAAPLKDFHSRWYDVGSGFSSILSPVEPGEEILQRIDERLGRLKRRRII